MAYDDSEALQPDNSYSLGGYTFDLNVSYIHEPDEDLVAVSAICDGPDGRRESSPIYLPNGTTIESWYVEANETEARVYATLKSNVPPLDTSPVPQPIPQTQSVIRYSGNPSWAYPQDKFTINSAGFVCKYASGRTVLFILSSELPMAEAIVIENIDAITGIPYKTTTSGDDSNTFTYNGKTVYYTFFSYTSRWDDPRNTPELVAYDIPNEHTKNIAWAMVYGNFIGPHEEEKIVASFSIDIREADGGPDGDWDEPGNDGPPNKTLYVTVVGASAGVHDPTVFPTENKTAKGYGFGGDGGHGGGGGAGASTVIIYDFATSKADEVVQEAITKSPGNGSGGGKGGKGGDGCILIFY